MTARAFHAIVVHGEAFLDATDAIARHVADQVAKGTVAIIIPPGWERDQVEVHVRDAFMRQIIVVVDPLDENVQPEKDPGPIPPA